MTEPGALYLDDNEAARLRVYLLKGGLGLIRFGGHNPKGGYDVHNG